MIIKTKEELKREALEKYNRISENKKQEHLNNRKEAIKKNGIISAVLLLALGVLLVIVWAFTMKTVSLVFGIIAVVCAIISVVRIFKKLSMPEKEIIIEELVDILKTTYVSWSPSKVFQARACVKKHSKMCKAIEELNNSYRFDRNICTRHSFRELLESKRQFDNFDFSKWIFSKMDSMRWLFERLEPVYKENLRKYEQYSLEYDSLEEYTQEIEVENLDIEYEIFHYAEREIFQDSKHPSIIEPCIFLQISYTSPSGRNHYSTTHTYTYGELLFLAKEKKAEEEKFAAEKERKDYLNKQKREKEQKLKELDKIEKQLSKKEKELDEKQKEFLEATKEHVYTVNKDEAAEKASTEIKDGMSLLQKMKILRKKFDDGEITYEEYQKVRKELL